MSIKDVIFEMKKENDIQLEDFYAQLQYETDQLPPIIRQSITRNHSPEPHNFELTKNQFGDFLQKQFKITDMPWRKQTIMDNAHVTPVK